MSGAERPKEGMLVLTDPNLEVNRFAKAAVWDVRTPANRKPNTVGVVLQSVHLSKSSDGSVWMVRHEDGVEAPYVFDELMEITEQDRDNRDAPQGVRLKGEDESITSEVVYTIPPPNKGKANAIDVRVLDHSPNAALVAIEGLHKNGDYHKIVQGDVRSFSCINSRSFSIKGFNGSTRVTWNIREIKLLVPRNTPST